MKKSKTVYLNDMYDWYKDEPDKLVQLYNATFKSSGRQCRVTSSDDNPDRFGRIHFFLCWLDDEGKLRSQCFFDKLNNHVVFQQGYSK